MSTHPAVDCCLAAMATAVHKRHIAYSMHVTIFIYQDEMRYLPFHLFIIVQGYCCKKIFFFKLRGIQYFPQKFHFVLAFTFAIALVWAELEP
jgi:hypothetical protein